MKKLAILGSGGFAKEVAELAELNGYRITACYSLTGGAFENLHRGYLPELERDRGEFDGVLLGIGAVDRETLAKRRWIIDWVMERNLHCPPIVSPHALCARGVTLGDGVVVAHGAVLGVDSNAGPFSMFNVGAIVGHDVSIGTNVIIAPGAFVGGSTSVGENSLVGPLAKVLQGVALGSDTLVGIGCLAIRDLLPGQTVWPRLDRLA